jgi:hypothetical protein
MIYQLTTFKKKIMKNQEHQTRPEETGVSDIDADSQGPEVEHDD